MIEQSPLEKYADPSGPRRMIGCSQERVEEQIRIALDGHPESELWGENGLIAATMRAVNSVEELTRQRDEARELARELRDNLQLASDLLERAGREDATRWEPGQSWIFWEDKCAAKNDVQAIRGMLIKAKEVLP